MNLLEFEIFKTGTHTASNGNTKTFETSDLQNICSNYNPQQNEAPIVLGHPWNDDAPAYGWIKNLKLSDDNETLIAEGELSDELVDLIKEKKYKKRSISLGADHNLLHVGFLGAATPAVKGLADINFSQNKDDHSEFEFSNETENNSDLSAVAEANPNLETNNFSKNENELISEILSLKSEIEKLNSDFSQFISKDELHNLLNQFTSLKPVLSEREGSETCPECIRRIESSDFDSFLNDKIASGNLTPAMKEQIISFCKEISSMNFSGENFSVNFTSFIKNFISSFPQLNLFEEFATKPEGSAGGGNKKNESFNGLYLDPQSYAMHKKALELCDSEKITYSEAIHKLLNN